MGGSLESLTGYTQARAQTLDCSQERGLLQLGSVLARVRAGLPSPAAQACNGDGMELGRLCLGQEGGAKQLRAPGTPSFRALGTHLWAS